MGDRLDRRFRPAMLAVVLDAGVAGPMLRLAQPPRIADPLAHFGPGSLAGVAGHAVFGRDFENFGGDSPATFVHSRPPLQRAIARSATRERSARSRYCVSLFGDQAADRAAKPQRRRVARRFGELAAGGELAGRIEPAGYFQQALAAAGRGSCACRARRCADRRAGVVARLQMMHDIADGDFRRRPAGGCSQSADSPPSCWPLPDRASRQQDRPQPPAPKPGGPFASAICASSLLHGQVLPQVRLANQRAPLLPAGLVPRRPGLPAA